MNTYEWYQQLVKPSFAPSSEVFGMVWGVLYPIIAVSFGYVFYMVYKKKYPKIVLVPFVINIVTNLLFTPIQFGLKSNLLASMDISIVVISLVWAMIKIYPYSKIVTLAQIPYLLWGLFATTLQFSITYLNR